MTRQESRRASARLVIGVAGLLGGAGITAFFPPFALPICVCAGMAVFVLALRSALRIARVDDLVFEHRPTWQTPKPPVSRSRFQSDRLSTDPGHIHVVGRPRRAGASSPGLRSPAETGPNRPRWIRTEPWVGYRSTSED